MERGDEEAPQESTRRGAWQIGWFGAERGQKGGPIAKTAAKAAWWQPLEKTCRPAQPQTAKTGNPKEGLVAAVAVIRWRFGYGAIGLGCSGIRYSTAVLP